MNAGGLPSKQGLYDPQFEHDSCGVGFLCNIKGARSNEIVMQGIEVLRRLAHRGATGSDPKTGDGAGATCCYDFSRTHSGTRRGNAGCAPCCTIAGSRGAATRSDDAAQERHSGAEGARQGYRQGGRPDGAAQ